MGYKVLNNAFSTLAGSLSNVDLSMTVDTGEGDRFPVIAGADYTYVTLEDVAGNIEIVKVTARATTSDVFTIVRAQDGTTARNWAAGDIVELRMVALLMDQALAHVDDTTDAHLASAIKNIPAGNVSASNVQTAINELDGDLSATISSLGSLSTSLSDHIASATDAHDASSISYAGGAGITATDVEAAIDELATEKAKSGTNTDITALDATTVTYNGVELGWRLVPQVSDNDAHTITATDSAKHIYGVNSGAQTITIPTNAVEALPVGFTVTLINNGTTAMTISSTGVTVYKAGTSAAWASGGTIAVRGMVTLIKVATDTWFISGAGMS